MQMNKNMLNADIQMTTHIAVTLWIHLKQHIINTIFIQNLTIYCKFIITKHKTVIEARDRLKTFNI